MEKIWVITLIEALLLLVYCIYMVWSYASKERTPIFVKATTVFGWFLGFMIILIIPLDIFKVKVDGNKDSFMIDWWYFNYWTIFAMNWFIIPFMIEYFSSGDFTYKEKFKRAIRNFIPQFILYISVFILGIVILACYENGRAALKEEGVLGCIIGLSLIFGFLELVILLGYGLVQIPLSYFRLSSNNRRLKMYQYKVTQFNESLLNKSLKCQKLISVANQVQVQNSHQKYKLHIIETINRFVKAIAEEDLKISARPQKQVRLEEKYQGTLSYDKLIKLRQKIKFQTIDILRLITFKKEAIERAIFQQDIVDAVSRGDSVIKSYFVKDRDPIRCCDSILIQLTYSWYVSWKPILMLIFGVIFTALSLIIWLAEILYCFGVDNDIINDMIATPDLNNASNYIIDNLVCLIPLVYLIAATNYGLFRLRTSKIYALHPNHNTDPSCLLFSCLFIMRLSVPIVYNFLLLTEVKATAAFEVLSPVSYVNFMGESFNKYAFPCLLTIMILLSIFNLYSKLMICIGLKQYAFDNDYQEEKIEEGRKIVEQYRNEKLLLLGTSKSNRSSSRKKILPDLEQPVMTSVKRSKINQETLDGSDLLFSSGNEDNQESPDNNDNKGSFAYDNSRMSARMSVNTFRMDDDEEEQARKGLRGFFRKVFHKK